MKKLDVAVLILTDNCVETIDGSVRSALDQSFPHEHLRIVAVDNASTDGTYEKLVGYALENDVFSVYRVSEKLLHTRLLLKALDCLEFLDCDYLTILRPGDGLYTDCIEKCATVLDGCNHTGALIVETDLIGDDGKPMPQTPVYSRNCKLMKTQHYTQFFSRSPGHKVQCIYSKKGFDYDFTIFPFLTDYTDWFKRAATSFSMECIYLRDPLGAVRPAEYEDPFEDLMLRLLLVKRLEMMRKNRYSGKRYEYLDKLASDPVIPRNLAMLALRYASDALLQNDRRAAGKILLFSEMVFEPVVETEFFAALKSSLESEKPVEGVDGYLDKEMSIAPPEGATILPDLFGGS